MCFSRPNRISSHQFVSEFSHFINDWLHDALPTADWLEFSSAIEHIFFLFLFLWAFMNFPFSLECVRVFCCLRDLWCHIKSFILFENLTRFLLFYCVLLMIILNWPSFGSSHTPHTKKCFNYNPRVTHTHTTKGSEHIRERETIG